MTENKKIISFLLDLSKNNNKTWFNENKKIYENLRKYFIDLTNVLIAKINTFDAKITNIDAKKSIYRINRDLRFTKNKTPYKTNFGAHIASGGKKSGNAGYYLHIQPKNSFLAAGIYNPNNKILDKIRWEIYENPNEFTNIINTKDFIKNFTTINGQKLKNPPKGFDKSFENIELLKFKSYIILKKISEKNLFSYNFINYTTNVYKKTFPFVTFLNKAIQK